MQAVTLKPFKIFSLVLHQYGMSHTRMTTLTDSILDELSPIVVKYSEGHNTLDIQRIYIYYVLLNNIPRCGLEIRVMYLEFSYKNQTFYIVYIAITKPFEMDFNIWHDSIYMSKVFPSAIPTLGHGFEAKVTDLEFSFKCQIICL